MLFERLGIFWGNRLRVVMTNRRDAKFWDKDGCIRINKAKNIWLAYAVQEISSSQRMSLKQQTKFDANLN